MEEESQTKLLDPETCIANVYDGEEDMYQSQLRAGLKAFHKGGDIEKMIDIYKKNDWHIVETKEWKTFETQVHKLKGRFRFIGMSLLAEKFEKLQYAIRDGHFISVPMLLEKSLQAMKPTQITALDYLKEPHENLFSYQPNELCEFYQKIYNQSVKSELKVFVQQPSLRDSMKLVKYLVLERDPNLKCEWADEPQEDNGLKCSVF